MSEGGRSEQWYIVIERMRDMDRDYKKEKLGILRRYLEGRNVVGVVVLVVVVAVVMDKRIVEVGG
jgi:hypothetical protein